jgi:DNA replication protein DnaC
MERTQVLTLMGELKLYGMRLAYDDVMDLGIKRQHEPPHIVGDLLKAEIVEKQARSIRYQFKIAKLPLAKDIDDFTFDDTPINETLVRDLATGTFIANQRNAVLIGGTGKTYLAIAIARSCIRTGLRGRFFNVVDLVNRLESETRAGKQGRIADYMTRLDFVLLDELGYLPFAQAGGQLLFHLVSKLYERTSIIPDQVRDHHQSHLRRMAISLRPLSAFACKRLPGKWMQK